jgi:hypothetical protein
MKDRLTWRGGGTHCVVDTQAAKIVKYTGWK